MTTLILEDLYQLVTMGTGLWKNKVVNSGLYWALITRTLFLYYIVTLTSSIVLQWPLEAFATWVKVKI